MTRRDSGRTKEAEGTGTRILRKTEWLMHLLTGFVIIIQGLFLCGLINQRAAEYFAITAPSLQARLNFGIAFFATLIVATYWGARFIYSGYMLSGGDDDQA